MDSRAPRSGANAYGHAASEAHTPTESCPTVPGFGVTSPWTPTPKKEPQPRPCLVMTLSVYMSHLRHPALEPFLDLFVRINDGVQKQIVQQQRAEVEQIMVALEPFEDLLPRLDNEALARLTDQEEIAVEFWRRCCVSPERLAPAFQIDSAPTGSSSPPRPAAAVTSGDRQDEDDEDDEDDVFVLTIDEDEPKAKSATGKGADGSMDWGDL